MEEGGGGGGRGAVTCWPKVSHAQSMDVEQLRPGVHMPLGCGRTCSDESHSQSEDDRNDYK